tara:strand:+ start:919 stop:1227 length:309 start_codon:yes stop_codon:yes gene_type:complete
LGGVGIWAFEKITQYFLLGKRIGGEITTSDINDKSNNSITTENKCGTTNATVDKRGRTFEKTVYAIRNLNIVITVQNVVQCGDLWLLHSWFLLCAFYTKSSG